MNNAVTISDEVFELSGKLAKKLKVSRSKIVSMSVKKMAEEHFEEDDVTARLNEVYSKEDSSIDPVIFKMALMALPRDEW